MLAFGRGEARPQTQDTLEVIQALFGDLAAAQSLGYLYIAQGREPTGAIQLLHLALGSTPTASIRGRIARHRARDFAAGDMAVLDGWIFSRTEARLLALTIFS